MRVIADIVEAHVKQASLAGALKNAGFKVRREDVRQEGEHLELHGGIVAYSLYFRLSAV
jgi:hypothetical protein